MNLTPRMILSMEPVEVSHDPWRLRNVIHEINLHDAGSAAEKALKDRLEIRYVISEPFDFGDGQHTIGSVHFDGKALFVFQEYGKDADGTRNLINRHKFVMFLDILMDLVCPEFNPEKETLLDYSIGALDREYLYLVQVGPEKHLIHSRPNDDKMAAKLAILRATANYPDLQDHITCEVQRVGSTQTKFFTAEWENRSGKHTLTSCRERETVPKGTQARVTRRFKEAKGT